MPDLVTTASNVICIGAAGKDVNNSCYIGKSSAQLLRMELLSSLIQTAGLARSLPPRFKEEIKPMDEPARHSLRLSQLHSVQEGD